MCVLVVLVLRAAFTYSEAAERYDFGARHPLRPERVTRTLRLVADVVGFSDDAPLLHTEPAAEEDLLTAHSREYLDEVRRLSKNPKASTSPEFGFLQTDNPPFAGMWEASLAYTGASLAGAQLILDGGARSAFNVAGGLHHAMYQRASGFCIINDCVVAIRMLLAQADRVAYVDLDAHHGDGVQAAFYDDPRVLTVSLHEAGQFLFPGTGYPNEIGEGQGKGFSVNVPLWPGTGDDVFISVFDRVVLPLISAFRPDVVVTQLGADSHRDDPLTDLRTSTASMEHAVQYFASLGTPWLALGGGGYSLTAAPRVWTIAWCRMCGRDVPKALPPSLVPTYGTATLCDPEPTVSPKAAVEFAERMVQEVQRNVFPYHDL